MTGRFLALFVEIIEVKSSEWCNFKVLGYFIGKYTEEFTEVIFTFNFSTNYARFILFSANLQARDFMLLEIV